MFGRTTQETAHATQTHHGEQNLAGQYAGRAWSRELMVGDRPPCTQNMRLSMSADRLRHST